MTTRTTASHRLTALSFAMIAVAIVPACKRDTPSSGASSAASATTTSGTVPSAASADAAAVSRVGAVTKVASGVRADLGVSLVALGDGRPALGYVGSKGVAVMVLDADAKWGELPTKSAAVDAEFAAFDAKATRASETVIPVAVVDGEVQFALDAVLTRADKKSHLRCGYGDGTPAVVRDVAAPGADGGDAPSSDALGEVRHCRTVVVGGRVATLVSSVRTTNGVLESVLAIRTTAVPAPGGDGGEASDGAIAPTAAPAAPSAPVDAILATRAVPGNKGPVQERHVFDPVGAVTVDGGGLFAVARWGGHIVTAHKDDAFQGDEAALFTWLDVTAGPPALTARDRTFAYVVPAIGKLDLFGAAFAVDAKLPKPARIAAASLVAPGAVAADVDAGPSDEVAATVLVPVSGTDKLFFAWLQGKTGQRRARGAFIDASLAPVGASFELYDGAVAGVRAVSRPEGKALVALLTPKGELLTLDVDGK